VNYLRNAITKKLITTDKLNYSITVSPDVFHCKMLYFTYLDRFSIISGDLFLFSLADLEPASSMKASFDLPANNVIQKYGL